VAWFSGVQCLATAPLLVLGPEIAERSLHGSAAWGLVVGGPGGADGARRRRSSVGTVSALEAL
jgi:hypothetical protein